jgi:Fe2+ or Zn2+ uptake regulation protein
MKKKENDFILSVLRSDLRREILRLLSNQEMTTQDVFKALKTNKNFNVSYRENIYKELEQLVESGLATKGYDYQRKKLYYKSDLEKIIVNIKENSIIFEKRGK